MKIRKLLKATVGAFLALAAVGTLHAAPVQQIRISDLSEGAPTFDYYLGAGYIISSVATAEKLVITGNIIELSVNSGMAFTRSVTLLESAGGPVSDFLTFSAGDTDCSQAGFTGHCDQAFSIVFESAGAPGFLSDLAGLNLVGSIVENGTYQELDVLLGTYGFGDGIFSVQVQSNVPEPASLALLGLGLAGLGFSRRRKA